MGLKASGLRELKWSTVEYPCQVVAVALRAPTVYAVAAQRHCYNCDSDSLKLPMLNCTIHDTRYANERATYCIIHQLFPRIKTLLLMSPSDDNLHFLLWCSTHTSDPLNSPRPPAFPCILGRLRTRL
jgi:hypothetical protein